MQKCAKRVDLEKMVQPENLLANNDYINLDTAEDEPSEVSSQLKNLGGMLNHSVSPGPSVFVSSSPL